MISFGQFAGDCAARYVGKPTAKARSLTRRPGPADAGLLACPELDDALGLSAMTGDVLADARTGRNGRHALVGLLRQSVFGARITYAIRLPANRVLQERIGHLLKRPVGRPPNHIRRASLRYEAGSWTQPRRVIAKGEWHPGELVPRVGFIITSLSRPAERVVAFHNGRGTAEQWIKIL
jgi:hypothetical protein